MGPVMLLEGLNAPQREAVLHEGGPLLVFAGAGSGKTRVITHRVAHLVTVRDLAPFHILAVTFTNKAASEMRQRLERMLGGRARHLWVGTFHATCARILRRYSAEVGVERDFVIYDADDQKALVKRVLKELDLSDTVLPPKDMVGRIERAKQEVRGPDEVETEGPWDDAFVRVYARYEERLRAAGALDFGDLIYRLVRALESNASLRAELEGRFRHILVDEFQDTNHVQYRLVRALGASHQQLTVVGDDDQSIYRWRGADRRNILDFRREFPGSAVIKLEQNYRSSARILRAAHGVIRRAADREPKTLWTENADGAPVCIVGCEDERQEAWLVVDAVRELWMSGRALEDMAVFYRVHAQSRVLEEALRARDLPYRVVGGTRFYDRAEVKDMLAYLRVLHRPQDDVSVLRILNRPTRGIGKKTVEGLLEAAAREGAGVFSALERAAAAGAKGPAKRLAAFAELVKSWREGYAAGAGLSEVAARIYRESGYERSLREQDSADADARMQNIEELIGSMQAFEHEVGSAADESGDDVDEGQGSSDPLTAYLERVALESEVKEEDAALDRLTLMTVHAAKGLEFPIVFVTGMEEEMFPFVRGAHLDEEALDEERRLAYVAFTRAEERLLLTWASQRRIFGQARVCRPSRFLLDIPDEDTEVVGRLRGPSRFEPSRPREHLGSHGGLRGGYPSHGRAAPPRSASHSTEPYVDRSEGSDLDEGLHQGMAVRHRKFGVGTVCGLTASMQVEVRFPGYGKKTIAPSYLEPA